MGEGARRLTEKRESEQLVDANGVLRQAGEETQTRVDVWRVNPFLIFDSQRPEKGGGYFMFAVSLFSDER